MDMITSFSAPRVIPAEILTNVREMIRETDTRFVPLWIKDLLLYMLTRITEHPSGFAVSLSAQALGLHRRNQLMRTFGYILHTGRDFPLNVRMATLRIPLSFWHLHVRPRTVDGMVTFSPDEGYDTVTLAPGRMTSSRVTPASVELFRVWETFSKKLLAHS